MSSFDSEEVELQPGAGQRVAYVAFSDVLLAVLAAACLLYLLPRRLLAWARPSVGTAADVAAQRQQQQERQHTD